MRKFAFILFLILAAICTAQSELRIKWETLKSPANSSLTILKGSSISDFWVYDQKGTIYHHFENEWRSYFPDLKEQITSNSLFKFIDDSFILFAWDTDWRTHIKYFEDGKWTSENYICNLPLQGIINIDDQNTYAYGNFGTFLKFENNTWKEIETPFENHIQATAFISPHSIWLGTKYDGIYEYDGQKFKFYPFDDGNNYSVLTLNYTEEFGLEAITSISKIFRLDNGKFVEIPRSKSSYKNSRGMNIEQYHQTLLTDIAGNIHFIFPPEKFKVRGSKYLDDGTVIITSIDGQIRYGLPQDDNFFYNGARIYNVQGNADASTLFGAVLDLNNDNQNDIFLLQTSRFFSKIFWVNDPGQAFIDVTQSSNIIKIIPSTTTSIVFGDLNKDFHQDFTICITDTSGSRVEVYFSDGSGGFELSSIIILPMEFSELYPNSISLFDYDIDGDLDINLTFYYGTNTQRGTNVILENSFWGNFSVIDTALTKAANGWNRQSIDFDADNDNINEMFISTYWGVNKFLVKEGNLLKDKFDERMDKIERNESDGNGVFDFDLDGDLDIFVLTTKSFIEVYQNDGNGMFSEISAELFDDSLRTKIILQQEKASINFGDFNNDSYVDIFCSYTMSETSQNLLLISDSAKYFVDKTEQYELHKNYVHGSLVADFDGDGDIDIYGYRNEENLLLLNNLNDRNFLQIKLVGVKSNTDAIGSKVWIYRSGHLNDHEYLAGFKQLGTTEFGIKHQNSFIMHFGLSAKFNYDIKVQFYGGEEKIIENVNPSQLITIKEIEGPAAFAYQVPANLYRIFSSTNVQFYLITFILGMITLFIGVRIGIEKFKWDIKLSLALVVVNTTIFWIILLLTQNSVNELIKYALPYTVVFVGIALPNLLFIWMNRNERTKSIEEYEEELLSIVVNFSHGEWALRNLNSLKLLCENVSTHVNKESRFQETLLERIKTFTELTLPNIKKIISLSRSIGYNYEKIDELKKYSDNVELQCYSIKNDRPGIKKCRMISESITKIKNDISEIASFIKTKFSCTPEEIINDVSNEFTDTFTKQNIELIKSKSYIDKYRVLIRGFELADILDNAIQNAIDSFDKNSKNFIEITLYRSAPKILIDIRNNGNSIQKENWDKIFEAGYSEKQSTGFGLFNARKALSKYGGRIFVKNSSEENGTTFTIELNEGK
ncbi:MAG: FG-GAP-like repeat-containing protein [Melioribacteraceae bacterium]|nr:FG-GAP-like repeat-containing protein [Melioribacteraceae bacterium]MCF8354266.1 FG-GAP-like repeat-containing protein [Melioribacteraceae bacterium]MCF8394602.1 FG-GAP-like repeat-containing protein [Melioribacteraceae bacterium]MCF8419729.1 FG-GAP-like repeat-containing protein [Melioribacteraceae bacterium]